MPDPIGFNDAVPSECARVKKLVIRPLRATAGVLTRELLVAGRKFVKGKLLLSSRKDQYIDDFNESGLTPCNSRFGVARSPFKLKLKLLTHGFATDATLIGSNAVVSPASASLNGISLGVEGSIAEFIVFWSVRTNKDIPGNFPGPPDAIAPMRLVTPDETNTLALMASGINAKVSGVVRKAVMVDGSWWGTADDQLYLIDDGGNSMQTQDHIFYQDESGNGSNAPTFMGPNVTDARLDYIDPKGGPDYSTGGNLTIKGNGFVNGVNIASLDGTPVTTTFVDEETLTASIPSSYPGDGVLTVSGRAGWFFLYN